MTITTVPKPATTWTTNANDMFDTNALYADITETDPTMNAIATRIDLVDEAEPDISRPPDELVPDDVVNEPVRAPVARCADGNGTMVGLFFSDHVVDIARAKAMCGLCQLTDSCLAEALEREEPWGVWGGELLSGGRIIANKRPCGRPPKNPRPDVIYDEMGPVGAVLTVA